MTRIEKGVKAFKVTVIYPVNRKIFGDKDFAPILEEKQEEMITLDSSRPREEPTSTDHTVICCRGKQDTKQVLNLDQAIWVH